MQHYALPQKQKYPIDTVEQVKTASAYLGKYLTQLAPSDRVAMATNIEKRAAALGVALDNPSVYNYSRTETYSPDFDLHMTMRKQAALGRKIKINGADVDCGDVINKIACLKHAIAPTQMVDLISDFDKKAGFEVQYDRRIRDPFFTVYGSTTDPRFDQEKIASATYKKDLESAVHGNPSFMSKIAESFGSDFAEGFKQDPVNVYASMPTPEKDLILSHLQETKDHA